MRLFLFIVSVMFCVFTYADDNIKLVYRAAMESPEDVKAMRGFLPRGMDGNRPNQPPPDISLWNHTQGSPTGTARHGSGYVSTTTSRGFAIYWVNERLNHNAYVYHIHPTPNFIDVNGTLRNYSPHPDELEYAALGRIHWNQIIGWERVRGGVVEEFVRNPDYSRGLYSTLHTLGAQPHLAGFPDGHPAWADEPWLAFAHCHKRSSAISCSPNETAQQYGNDWFQYSNGIVLGLIVSLIV